MDYQFTGALHIFKVNSHGNSLQSEKEPFMRTQQSTLQSLKEFSKTKPPRICIDLVQEMEGGVSGCSSNSSLPRNVHQVYNLNRGVKESFQTSSDPHTALILMCKEQAKNEKTAFVDLLAVLQSR